MKEQDTITGTQLKTIYDNDVAILDYLADMPDRALLKQLQTFINDGNHEPSAILHKDIRGHLTLLLYKAPLGFNKGSNNLTLYSCGSLGDLCYYFKQWRDRTNPFDKLLVKALTEITNFLYYYLINDNENIQPKKLD